MEKITGKKVENNRKKLVFWKNSFFKSLLPFITFVNYEHAYLVVKFLHILFSHFAFSKKARKKQKNFVERVAVCRVLVDYNICIAKQGIKEAAVPNIPSRKTSLW